MKKDQIVTPVHQRLHLCPHCHKKLDVIARMELALRKKCRCRHCNGEIDERFKVY